ncbi:hypothetical protein PS15m_012342 [Mucor circinelloides]
MKLRDRQKRVSSDIKQEDYKFDPTPINLSFSTVNESSTCNLDIKQEDSKNYSSLLKQNGRFEEGKDYYYRCDRCDERMPNLQSVLQHRRSVHNVKSSKASMVKNVNTEPDIHDPNFYCKPCKVDYKSKKDYRHHLKHTHCMALKVIPSRKKPLNSITPDPDDPNRHCRACDRTFANKTNYKQHCRYTHGMASVKYSNYSLALDGITDTYCKLCDVRLSNKTSYKKHLITMHKIDWRLNHQRPKSIATDVNDPNNYCRACKKVYSSRGNYRAHLRILHQIALPTLKGNVNNDKLPDSSDPNHYCSVCKKSFMSRPKYRSHCKQVHYMVLDHYNISNPSATIDINHAKFYCAQCEHSYCSKSVFRMHLKDVHNIRIDIFERKV